MTRHPGWNLLARDHRLITKSLSTGVTMPSYTLHSWQERAAHIRDAVRWWSGPEPRRRSERPDVHVVASTKRDGFRILNLAIGTLPGFYATGNLYVPDGPGPFPAILNPHGHWPAGRLEDSAVASVPARCINFALRGYVALSYDMVGYGDSRPIGHRFGAENTELECWTISLLGLQLQNSIACLDYLCSLPFVDRSRIGCTGASGGGSQAMLLAALDDRINATAIVNMISSTCQGWCLCENCAGLRLETHNVEVAATIAPRPLLLVSASGDWTHNTPNVEFPSIQRIYALYGASDRVANAHFDAPHNYNMDSRQAVYRWFDRCFAIEGSAEEYLEIPFPKGEEDTLHVELGSVPLVSEAEIVQTLRASAQADAEHSANGSAEDARLHLGRCFGAATLGTTPSVIATLVAEEDARGRSEVVLLRKGLASEILPCRIITPHGKLSGAVVLLESSGGDTLLGNHSRLVECCLRAGCVVLIPALFLTSCWTGPQGSLGRSHRDPFFTTYNRTDAAEWVRDAVAAVEYAVNGLNLSVKLLVGLQRMSLTAIFAAALNSNAQAVALDFAGTKPDDTAIQHAFFVPGLERAGGLASACRALAPRSLFMFGVGENDQILQLAKRIYLPSATAVSAASEQIEADASISHLLSSLALA